MVRLGQQMARDVLKCVDRRASRLAPDCSAPERTEQLLLRVVIVLE
jgi:hypothetical protein